MFHFNGETHNKQKKGDLHSVPAPEEAFTTKHTGERHSTAESSAPLRIVGENSPLETQ